MHGLAKMLVFCLEFSMTLDAWFGSLHYYSALVALLTGSWVLSKPKGTPLHRQVGLAYVLSMGVMLISAFLTYRLFGHFGMFHWLSVIASLTLFAGMYPLWSARSIRNARLKHLQFMYWSVIGLYMGLAAEVFTRIPDTPFLSMVVTSSGVVYALGILGMILRYRTWYHRYVDKQHDQQP
jgi:uncharacterized membrane protein